MQDIAEDPKAAALLDAQRKASVLFDEIEHSLLRPGITERQLSREIHDLAGKLYGVKRHWHKRVIRTGINTLQPYNENPPDLMIQDDDILFADLGPVFEGWEADFGRTYVLGTDPVKQRLRDDLEPVFRAVKAKYQADPAMTGEALYDIARGQAADAGWTFGGAIAGHLVGEFPHERIAGDKVSLYIRPGNKSPLDTPDAAARKRHWILEIHLVDRARQIGGFYEELLTVG